MNHQARNKAAIAEQKGYGVEVRPGMRVEVEEPGTDYRKDGIVLSVAEHGAFVRLDDPETSDVVGVLWADVRALAAPPVPVGD